MEISKNFQLRECIGIFFFFIRTHSYNSTASPIYSSVYRIRKKNINVTESQWLPTLVDQDWCSILLCYDTVTIPWFYIGCCRQDCNKSCTNPCSKTCPRELIMCIHRTGTQRVLEKKKSLFCREMGKNWRIKQVQQIVKVLFFVLSTEVFLSCKCIHQTHGIIGIMQKSSFHVLGLFIYALIRGESVYISVQPPWIPAYNGSFVTRKSGNVMGLGTLTWTARIIGTLRSSS